MQRKSISKWRHFDHFSTPASTIRKPVFEPLEDRRLMSAATIAAVNFEQREPKLVKFGQFTFVEYVNVPSTAVFSIGSKNAVYENTGSTTASTNLGGTAMQITAGLDTAGQPVVYGITPGNTVVAYHAGKWSALGLGGVTEISASIDGVVYAKGSNHNVWKYNGSTWTNLQGQATVISGGVDAGGNPEVFATGYPITTAYVNDGGGWAGLAGPAFSDISGSINGTVYGIVANDANLIMVRRLGQWTTVGSPNIILQASAGLDASGTPEVFALDLKFTPVSKISPVSTDLVYNDGGSWIDLGQNPLEIAAPAFGPAVAGNPVAIVAANGATLIHRGSSFFTMPSASLDAVGIRYQNLGGPTGTLGTPTSVESPVAGTTGTSQYFTNGVIFWSPATGAHSVQGSSLIAYTAWGGAAGLLGFPTSSVLSKRHDHLFPAWQNH
jgi:hypothetical protein